MRISIFPHILFISLALVSGENLADPKAKKGKITGASHVNLRSGPGISHPPIKILRIGAEVDVERLEGSWYRVSLPDGKRGYVYKPLVYLAEHEEGESVKVGNATGQEPGVPKEIAATDTNSTEEKGHFAVPRRQKELSHTNLVEKEIPKDNPPLTMGIGPGQVLVIAMWITAALCIFILGWILGGNYYLRRDRINRSKLHF
ncbi:MAG: SH3 domain-containing protein [Candidatus Binatia bacterium]